MDLGIFALLSQDGVTNGAIYALLAMSLVLVFSVTRIIFLPQGEFIGYGALTVAALQAGQFPQLIWMLLGMGVVTFAVEVISAWRQPSADQSVWRGLARSALVWVVYPLALLVLVHSFSWGGAPMAVQIALALAMTVPLGAMIYRVAFQPIAEASVLVLLIVAVGVHFGMLGMGLYVFGPEGSVTRPFSEWSGSLGAMLISGQSLAVMLVSAGLIGLLSVFFHRTLTGKALRATAVNRRGAQLVGIATAQAGRLAIALAAGLGTLAGALIAPLNAVAYDTGFVLALKGFVAAVVGGLASYPLAAVGAILVGLLESYSSYWASAYKEVIVFTLIIPVLAWRSLTTVHGDEE